MGKASSTKKIARMAQKGRGKKVRFQGGTLFPVVVLAVVVLGLVLIGYSRSSIGSAAPGPRASKGDHWHIAYGFYTCDATNGAPGYLPNLQGNIESNSKYIATGVHSHDDGVIHWHPFTAAASGRNAKLDVFLDNYGIQLTSTKLTFPSDQESGKVYEEGVTKCKDADGKEVDGVLKVFVWPDSSNPSDFRVLAANLDSVRITQNGMAIAVAFVPSDTSSIEEPPTAAKLPELGAVDSDQGSTSTVPADGSTVTTLAPGDSSATTVPGGTTAGTEPLTADTSTSTPATTVAATATTG